MINVNAHMEDMRKRSGNIVSDRKLVSFIYLLLRDYLPAADVEKAAMDSCYEEDAKDTQFTNGWLAKYAEDLANRLIES
jgi:hypothetical protein